MGGGYIFLLPAAHKFYKQVIPCPVELCGCAADSMKKPQKRYIVKKYIYASSISDAIKKDKHAPVEECWVDKEAPNQLPASIGFDYQNNLEEYESN